MFRKVLIANRGEIACRIQKTCKRLGIETVAVYSDADAQAPHVKKADAAERVGPAPVRESYLDQQAILDAAIKHGADAIHPGYGLLSENAEFARAVAARGLVFIGPSPEALDAFGDKIKARTIAKKAGASPPPGTDGPIDPKDDAAITAEAERIGFPLIIKAAGGGGGIGMQRVDNPDKLLAGVATCSDRGASAFGDARVYMERYLDQPRHIEVQILVDDHGHAVALGERECSAQRRHQKILEESPSPAHFFQGEAGAKRREQLHRDALSIAAVVGYRGAGTVEFVADSEGNLFFLEVNARLQVEHCVSEMVFGVDLVEEQLRIASGEPMNDATTKAQAKGHSIEARVYAEDPMKRFAPQPGRIDKLAFPPEDATLRIESGIEEGAEVTPYYDPMIAKVVAYGDDRKAAVARLDRALAETVLDLVGPKGKAETNIGFLRILLAEPDVVKGDYDTALAEAVAKRLRKEAKA